MRVARSSSSIFSSIGRLGLIRVARGSSSILSNVGRLSLSFFWGLVGGTLLSLSLFRDMGYARLSLRLVGGSLVSLSLFRDISGAFLSLFGRSIASRFGLVGYTGFSFRSYGLTRLITVPIASL